MYSQSIGSFKGHLAFSGISYQITRGHRCVENLDPDSLARHNLHTLIYINFVYKIQLYFYRFQSPLFKMTMSIEQTSRIVGKIYTVHIRTTTSLSNSWYLNHTHMILPQTEPITQQFVRQWWTNFNFKFNWIQIKTWKSTSRCTIKIEKICKLKNIKLNKGLH